VKWIKASKMARAAGVRDSLVDYRHLAALMRRLYTLPGVAETVRYDHILAHYYDGDWAIACRRGIVPEIPAVNWLTDNGGAINL
jgi:putative glutathione S-transferase